MKYLKIYENYITDLIQIKLSDIKVGNKIKFVDGELLKRLDNIIWTVNKIDYKRGFFSLISDDEKTYKTEVHISEIDRIKKLKDYEIDAEKYNL
jgi:hypothetical protein